MKIVVAAAVSQIGYWVLRQAANEGHEVIAGYRRRRFERPVANEVWVAMDLHHPADDLVGAPAGGADVFIHCGPPQFSARAARLAAMMNCHAVIAFGSTSALYHDLPRPHGDPVKAAMLRRMEQEFDAACTHHRIAGTLFRPTMIYGTGMDRNVCRLARMISRTPVLALPPDANGLRQPIHAADIASVALTAAKMADPDAQGRTRIFDIGGGEKLPYRTMVRRVADALGRNPVILPLPGLTHFARMAAFARPSLDATASALYRMNRDQVADNSAARLTFEFNPRAFHPTLEELRSPLHPVVN